MYLSLYSSRIHKWKAMVSISVSEFLCLTPLKGISISIFIVTLRIYNAPYYKTIITKCITLILT